jgi:hypothetical protein
VIKTLEAQVGQFLLGCKCPVSRFLPGRAKDLSASRYCYTRKQTSSYCLGITVSPMGPDPEKRVGDENNGSPGMPVSSGLQVPGQPFPSWSG